MCCLLQSWHCTYSVMYFLNKFSTLTGVNTVFIIKPLWPIDPELPPKSYKKKFITCSGCLSSCLQRNTKLVMAVFFDPNFSTFGGLSIIFVFSARSGLFLVSVLVILSSNILYLCSFLAATYSYFCFYASTFSFYFFLSFLSFLSFFKSIV